MTPEQAFELIKAGEGQRVEFKKSFAEENEAIETLCAFANADGGTVFFGVAPNGIVVGVHLGAKTLEDFANRLRANTDPSLTPSVDQLVLPNGLVVAASLRAPARGEVFSAFGKTFKRVGKTNPQMPFSEVKARLVAREDDWSEERDRPVFGVSTRGVRRLEEAFEPSLKVTQVSGDRVPDIAWRFRGPRFRFDGWRQAEGARLQDTNISAVFDLSLAPAQDDLVREDEMGLEIRFYWRRKWRRELHRWHITRRVLPQKVLWDLEGKVLPPVRSDEKE
ncbi:MAG: ATP-binding protein [Chloroflexota bacterium]|nr:ATP-binding protein [Chloroflexota bacterium]